MAMLQRKGPFLGTVLAVLVGSAMVTAADWPAWRGPDGQGRSAEKNLPLTWSDTENVRWKVPLPAGGNSTPIIWGDRVFLTQASKDGSVRSLMCLARADGKLLWQKDVEYAEKETTHKTNPYCSASPVTDGERVVVSHGSAGMYCYDFTGRELWKVDVGKLEHIWGNAASPIIHGELAILWCGPGERQFLLAVDRKTGKEVWRHEEAGGLFGTGGSKEWVGSWSTPLVVKIGEQDQLLLSMPFKLKSFDPTTGKEIWSSGGLGKLVYTSPLFADGLAVSLGGPSGQVAVKVGGTGDVTKESFSFKRGSAWRVGSGVIVGDHVYHVEGNGTPRCWELKTGKDVWEVETRPGTGGCWGSTVYGDGRVYVTNQNGDTLVFAADPKYQLLATNRLGKGEHTNSSIAIAHGDLFIRTYKHLWCIGKKDE
jgi:outer membrane protein assembly factor BamB